MFSFWYIGSKGSFVMVTSHNIINIGNSTWSHSDFTEISWPHSTVGIFGLILRKINGENTITNNSISFIPFLIVVLFKMMMSWVNCEAFGYHISQFKLFISFIHQYIVFFINHSMAIGTISSKDLKSSSNGA